MDFLKNEKLSGYIRNQLMLLFLELENEVGHQNNLRKTHIIMGQLQAYQDILSKIEDNTESLPKLMSSVG